MRPNFSQYTIFKPHSSSEIKHCFIFGGTIFFCLWENLGWRYSTRFSWNASVELDFFFFFELRQSRTEDFLRGGENLGSWLLTIVSWPFICLYSNRGIICLKWHHIVDGRGAYCLPFMSRMKETESYCSSRWDRRESTITLPHLHKASIHPLASQDQGLSTLRPRRKKQRRGEPPQSARARLRRGGRADVPSGDSQRNYISGRAGEGPIPLSAARPGWKKWSWRKPPKLLLVHRSEIYNHLSDSLQKPQPAGAATAHSASTPRVALLQLR